MAKYRKKPVVIEAVQWFKTGDHPEVKQDSYWKDTGVITTLEGDMRVMIGDWIIEGVEGELYPCKPEIFKKTYGKVEEGEVYIDGFVTGKGT